MDTPSTGNQIVSGSEHEVIGIVENDLAAGLADLAGGEPLDRAACADGHEGGGIKPAVRSLDIPDSGLRLAAMMTDCELKRLGHDKAKTDDGIQAESGNPIICAPMPPGECVSPSRTGWRAPLREPCRGLDRLRRGKAPSWVWFSPPPDSEIARALLDNDAKWGSRIWLGVSPLIVPRVPMGMKAGVSNPPCGVWIYPTLA